MVENMEKTNQNRDDVSLSSILPYIIAVDFDGVLVENAFPEIGKPNTDVINRLLQFKTIPGVRLILWTSRTGERLDEALQFLHGLGLKFDAVNDNADEVKAIGWDARKIFANEYWDDRAVNLWKSVDSAYYKFAEILGLEDVM